MFASKDLQLVSNGRSRHRSPVLDERTRPGALSSSDQLEQRRHRRVAVRAPARLVQGEREHLGHSEDLSEGGVFVVTAAELQIGEQLILHLELPEQGLVVTRAEVRRCRPANAHARVDAGVGLMYLDLPLEHRVALRALVERRLKPIVS
jgi:Tfp pilus assembly protein PilZ